MAAGGLDARMDPRLSAAARHTDIEMESYSSAEAVELESTDDRDGLHNFGRVHRCQGGGSPDHWVARCNEQHATWHCHCCAGDLKRNARRRTLAICVDFRRYTDVVGPIILPYHSCFEFCHHRHRTGHPARLDRTIRNGHHNHALFRNGQGPVARKVLLVIIDGTTKSVASQLPVVPTDNFLMMSAFQNGQIAKPQDVTK